MQNPARANSILFRLDGVAGQQLRLELVRSDHARQGKHLAAVEVHVLRRNVQSTLITQDLPCVRVAMFCIVSVQ